MQFEAHSYRFLRERAAEFIREHSPVLVLAPTRHAADDLVRYCCAQPGTALTGVYRHTLRDLALTLSERPMIERGLKPVRRIAREAIAADVTARSRSQLSYLAPVAGFPGFARALAQTLEHLRLNAVDPHQLASTGRSGTDLAILLEAYEAALEQQRLADHAARCRLALEAVQGRALLLLDVSSDHRLEQDLITAVAKVSSAVLELHAKPQPAPSESRLDSLQRYVLTGEHVPAIAADSTVHIFSASGEALECVEIARRILRLASSGTRFDQVAILLRSPERHQPLVSEALRRARIPAWYSDGVSRPDPSGRAFTALLHCAAEDFSAERFAEYLSMGQMPAAEDGEVRLSSQWERLLHRAQVISGLDRWERRLTGLAGQLETELDGTDRGVRQLAALHALRAFALPLVRILAELPQRGTWREWIDALSDLARRSLDRPQRIDELLEELEPMAGIGPVTLTDVLTVLGTELANIRKPEERPRYGRVFVGTLEEAAGMAFEAVFVPGMNEGVFPRPLREDPLFLDTQRAALSLQPAAEQDPRMLRIAVASASTQFTCSWSRIDLTTGRERVPSFYAFEVAESAGWGDLDVQAFLREARDQTEARLGWPAPSDAQDAVDASEYDLATLRPHWDDSTSGSGAWLKLANPHLYRALDARRHRWSAEWTWADGLVDADVHVGIELQKKHALAVRPWSPTRLEQFARCPYRMYLQGVLGLAPPERPEALQRIDPAIRGELYHEVQARLYTHLQGEGKLPVTPDSLNDAVELLNEILKTTAQEYADRCKPTIAIVWDNGIERISADLRGWLREVALHNTDWTPVHFEHQFSSIAITDRHLLQGRIDLIEQHADGTLRITDHKTGRPPSDDEVKQTGGAEFLQPVLYAMAANEEFRVPVREARLFYATLRGSYKVLPVTPDDEARQNATDVLDTIDAALRNGELPAAPRKEACKRCDYVQVCGPYEEQRVALKPPRRDLVRIREIR